MFTVTKKKLGLEQFPWIRTIFMFLDPNQRKYSKFQNELRTAENYTRFSSFRKVILKFRKGILKGAMDKKADGVIWLPFHQFSTIFNETLSKRLFFQGALNETFKSELTLLFFHSFQGGTKGKKLKNQKKQKKCSQMC